MLENLLDVANLYLLVGNGDIKLVAATYLEVLAEVCHSLVDSHVELPILEFTLQLLTTKT